MSTKFRKVVDVEKLCETFASFQCHGAVALVKHLALPENEDLVQLGSSTIGLKEILNEIFISEEARVEAVWFRTRSLHIGSADGSVSPLEWMKKLAGVFDLLPVSKREWFNQFCLDAVAMITAKPSGDVEIFNERGFFRVPPDVYKKSMSDEELEPYRATHSKIFGEVYDL